MDEYLDPIEFVHLAPREAGTRGSRHCGSSNNKALQITRKDNGDIVAFCHRCGRKGVHRNPLLQYRVPKELSSNNRIKPYIGGLGIEHWPAEARVRFVRYGITPEEAQEAGWRYNKDIHRLVRLIPNSTSWICRRIFDHDPDTRKELKFNNEYKHFPQEIVGNNKDSLVVVEDWLSAYKITKTGKDSALCLYGVNMTDTTFYRIIKEGYKNYYIWLDNDKPAVKRQQIRLRDKIAMLAKCNIILTDVDPKALSLSKIEGYLV